MQKFTDDCKELPPHLQRLARRINIELKRFVDFPHVKKIHRDARGVFTVDFDSGLSYSMELIDGYPFLCPKIICLNTNMEIEIGIQQYSPAHGLSVVVSVELECITQGKPIAVVKEEEEEKKTDSTMDLSQIKEIVNSLEDSQWILLSQEDGHSPCPYGKFPTVAAAKLEIESILQKEWDLKQFETNAAQDRAYENANLIFEIPSEEDQAHLNEINLVNIGVENEAKISGEKDGDDFFIVCFYVLRNIYD